MLFGVDCLGEVIECFFIGIDLVVKRGRMFCFFCLILWLGVFMGFVKMVGFYFFFVIFVFDNG